MNARSCGAAALLLATVLAPAGCTVRTEVAGPPPGPDGTLVVDWTIEGSKSGDACNATGATSMELSIFTSSDADVGVYHASCAAFGIDVDLPPGDYRANAVLVDGSDRARTTSIAIRPFTILGSDSLDVPIDFPSASFL